MVDVHFLELNRSGMHITMIAALAAIIMASLWRRLRWQGIHFSMYMSSRQAAALAGIVAALIYVMLAGWGVPAQRTLYMLIVVAVAMFFGRAASISHVLSLALFVVTVFDPWACLQPGFWLSFAAVAAILYASVGRVRIDEDALSRRQRWQLRLHTAAQIQYVITIALVPLTVLLFAQVSVVSPIANAIAIPLVSFVVTPAALIGSVLPAPVAGWVLDLAHALVALLALFLHWLSALPLAVWIAPQPPWWVMALAVCGTLWLLAPRGVPMRSLGLVALLPLIFSGPAAPPDGEAWVTAFDVGQGSAVLIETSTKRVLYDAGPSYSPEADGGNRVVVPYLKARGISALDAMIISHSDLDHVGGAMSILQEIDVGQVIASLDADHPVAQQAKDYTRCEAGQAWEWDGVKFSMLFPTPAIYESKKWKANARSCTLRAGVGDAAVLLPGDIEAVQEGHLLALSLDALAATVLLAPHHGSNTSSTAAFLDAVNPSVGIFQVGYANRYGHPRQEVLERYQARDIVQARTDESGAIRIRLGEKVEIERYRDQRPRYWHQK